MASLSRAHSTHRRIVQSADAGMAVEDAPLYWDAVWAFVAVGQIDKAEQYLAMHSVNQLPPSALTAHVVQPATQRQRELVETAVVLLQRMPRMPAAVGGGALAPLGQVHTSAVELMRHRERWRELCLKTLQDESMYDDCPVRDPPTPPLEIERSVSLTAYHRPRKGWIEIC